MFNTKAMEIKDFIKNLNQFTQDEIGQWLQAVKTNGMDEKEVSALTLAMAQSGVILSWNGLEPTVDKHSTGGIGDKITLLFVPLIAAYGINIPKLSGRSLGITGGTIDKLESISGLKTNLSIEQIKEQVQKIGLAVCSASSDLTPADKKLYAIRDVTNTIDSIPLIASSIMSKKIAGGAQNIILDVKFGSGAFMKTLEDARLLAKTMVSIGKNLNKDIKAVISNMNQPLGYAVGNSLEIKEILEVLSGKEVADLTEIVLCLAKEAIRMINPSVDEKKLRDILLGGAALKKFKEMIIAQGGDLKTQLKNANHIEIVKSKVDGYINNIDAFIIGEVVHALGAGRTNINDQIDYSVGIVFHKKYGDKVKIGDSILEIHAKSKEDSIIAKRKLSSAVKFEQKAPLKLELIKEIIK